MFENVGKILKCYSCTQSSAGYLIRLVPPANICIIKMFNACHLTTQKTLCS